MTERPDLPAPDGSVPGDAATELAAFVAFSEASGASADTAALAGLACTLLAPHGRAYFHDVPVRPGAALDGWADTAASAPGSAFADVPGAAASLASGEVVVSPDGAAVLGVYVLATGDGPRGLLSVRAAALPGPARAALRGTGRALRVALERADHAAQLATQNAELAARTEVLQGFAELSRELALEDDVLTLVGRAQDVVVSLLPRSVCTYYELAGPTWQLRSHRGEFRNPALLAGLRRGLPRGQTVNVDRPHDTREAFYQERYDPGTVVAMRDEIAAIRTSAAFPVFQGAQVRGVLVVGVHERRAWTSVERALLETLVGSLGAALERASQAGALRVRTLELERSNAELQQFAHVASHDLQEPLRSVTSFSQLLMSRFAGVDDPRAETYMQFVREGTARMAQLIQDLLAFSRVASQAAPPQPVALGDVLAQVRQDLALRERDPGGQVVAGDLPAVMADPTQVRQLLQNLVGNALKFRHPDRAPHVAVTADADGDMVRVRVQDNGIGIDAAYFDQIFTIFQRLHTREAYEGSGIGLSIARKIVERHGGRIDVASTPGEGTTFTFTLPAAPPDSPAG